MEVFRFHPKQWNPISNEVSGEVFNHRLNEWEACIFPLPDYIYDRCYYANEEHLSDFAIVKQLKKKTQFLSTGLPNKWAVFKAIHQDPTLSPFVLETNEIKSIEDVLSQLETNKRLVLKPKFGSQGKGILFLSMSGCHHIVVKTHIRGELKTGRFTKERFAKWLTGFDLTEKYLSQPFLQLTNSSNEPFDVRILIQKKADGNWQETGRGIRLGKKGNLVSNVHNGGVTKPFLIPDHQEHEILDQLNRIITTLPIILDQHFGPLFELGIDIGIDQTGTCWLLEANSKPGYRTIIETTESTDIYVNPLRYCLYLHSLK